MGGGVEPLCSRQGGETMPKGQEKSEKANKPKLSIEEKKKKKKEKAAAK